MIYYLIGGLGADKRVFDRLVINAETFFLDWLASSPSESLQSYVKRMSLQIDASKPFGIIGVSFGGIIAIELNKIIRPSVTILISSVVTSSQLPKSYVLLGKLGLLHLIPLSLIKPPQFLMNFMFGAVDKLLLKKIILATDPTFIRWALQAIVNWDSDIRLENIIRIHGTADRLIPLKGEAVSINGGGHFMIVDKAYEISEIINESISNNFIT